MTLSPGQWAPWISDPDPPEKPMTPEESKAAAQKVMERMRSRRKAAVDTSQSTVVPPSRPQR